MSTGGRTQFSGSSTHLMSISLCGSSQSGYISGGRVAAICPARLCPGVQDAEAPPVSSSNNS